MSQDTQAMEAAKFADCANRAMREQSWDVILPLQGVSSNPNELAFCINTKSAEAYKTDKGTMSVTAVLSDEREPDRAKEVLVLDGGDLAGWARNPLGLYQHVKTMPVSLFKDPTSGEFTVRRVGKQLIGTEYFVQKGPMAEIAEQVFQLHECGLLRGKSLGFLSAWADYERVPDDPNNIYGSATTKIKKWKAFECSSVFIPENDRSLVTQIVRKGLGQGTGLKALAAPLAAMLVQFADPAPEMVLGGTSGTPLEQTKTMPGGTNMDGGTGDQIKCTKCGCGYKQFANNTSGICPSCTALTVGELKKQLDDLTRPDASGKSLKDRADRLGAIEKSIGRGVGMDLDDYPGRPHQKALRAQYEHGMFNAASAIVDMQKFDGAAEASLRDYAANQIDIAQKALNTYAMTFPGEDMAWAALNPGDIADAMLAAHGDPDAATKSLVAKVGEWAIRTKGWCRGHTFRIQEAAKTLRELLVKPGDKPITADERTAIEAHVKAIDEMVTANGTLVHVIDRDTDEKIKKLGEIVNETTKALEQTRKDLNRAKYGRGSLV